MNWGIVGHGHLGSALAARFARQNIAFRHLSAQLWDQGKDLPQPEDALLLAVPDGCIVEVARQLQRRGHLGPVFHCSGATPLGALEPLPQTGVWYPMQSFRDVEVPWGSFPIYWENNLLEPVLKDLHQKLGIPLGQWMTSERRATNHLSAVWANNFPTHLVALYQDFCRQKGAEPMASMFLDSVTQALEGDARALQTGPARRRDMATLARHMEALPPELRLIYEALSESIARLDSSNS